MRIMSTGTTPVRFFVDDKLLGEDTDGAPYFVEWVDENPYEAREIEFAQDRENERIQRLQFNRRMAYGH